MAETRNQTLLESRSQLEEMRANQAQQSEQSLRQFEEQSKRDQDLRQELASLKSLLVELSMNQRPPGTPLNAFVPGSTSATPLHPDLQRSGTAQPRSSMFGQGVPPLPGGLSSRIAKVEFPKFDGSSIREWIYRYDQFFELDRTAPEMKVHLASLHMEDQKLTSQVHEIVGRINGRFGTLTAVPIHHLDRSLDFHALCALYAITDVALVSSLRDGMNLVSYDVPRKHGLKSDRYFLEPLIGMKFQSVPEVLCGASGSSSTVSTSERNFPGIEFDWGEEGFLPRVRDQKDSCYCMLCAAAVVFEGLYFIENKTNIDFSEQFLIDHYKDSPSGVVHTDFINKYRDGICKTADYPLNIKDGSYERRKKKFNIQGKEIFLMKREWNLFHYTVPDENRLMEQVRVQPMIAIIASSEGFSDHKGNRIYSTPNHGTLDHVVVITGYGEENRKKYWIGLASWGVGWGAKGYFRIKRGVGLCGLGSLFFAPCCRDALPRKEMKKKRKNKKRKVR